jgi:hypothetical protein
MLPVARHADLHLEEVGDDLVIYDHRTHAAHSLNAASAFVWEHCDGQRSPAEIAACARAAGLSWTDETIAQALAQLADRDLLEGTVTAAGPTQRLISRRVLTKAAVAALVPAIVSIATPAAAIALSGPGQGDGGPIRVP